MSKPLSKCNSENFPKSSDIPHSKKGGLENVTLELNLLVTALKDYYEEVTAAGPGWYAGQNLHSIVLNSDFRDWTSPPDQVMKSLGGQL